MQLIIAALVGILTIVLLIAVAKLHPFISLMVGSFVMAVCAGVPYDKAFSSFTTGAGSTFSGVGLLVAFGAIIGTILFASGGADVIVDTIMSKTPMRLLPWAMALIAFTVGIPMFFEVGVVILIPVVLFAARRAKMPVMLIAIPALAGLSTLHAFIPPHPGPLAAIDSIHANLGLTLGLGLLVAIPTVIISGPLLGKVMARWVPIMAPEQSAAENAEQSPRASSHLRPGHHRHSLPGGADARGFRSGSYRSEHNRMGPCTRVHRHPAYRTVPHQRTGHGIARLHAACHT